VVFQRMEFPPTSRPKSHRKALLNFVRCLQGMLQSVNTVLIPLKQHCIRTSCVLPAARAGSLAGCRALRLP